MNAMLDPGKKIPIFVQARMNSSRLPGKMLMHMSNGKTLLETVVRRCQRCQMTDIVAVLTSNEPTDAKIVEICRHNEISVFKGSLENVYERYTDAISECGAEAFVRICGDSPLISHRLIDYAIDVFKRENADFVSNIGIRTFPAGQSVEVISSKVFNSAQHKQSRTFSSEHVTQGLYDLNLKAFSIEAISTLSPPKLAIDTQEDFDSINSMMSSSDENAFEPDIGSIKYRRL